jgi:hypothetical protein
VWHPIQAVSFPQLLTGVLGIVSTSDSGVFHPQPPLETVNWAGYVDVKEITLSLNKTGGLFACPG